MTVSQLPILINLEAIAGFCREHGIRKLSLFGSVLRDDFDPVTSDVDVLVEFLPAQIPGWEFYHWHDDLGPILGPRVDLHTPDSLSLYFRDEVLRESLTLYETA